MTGYIVLNNDMSGIDHDIVFEIGKWYRFEGEIFSFRNGFLFYQKPEDIALFERLKEKRFFEIETEGEIFQENERFVAKKIRLIEEIPATEEMIKRSNYIGKTSGFMGVVFTLIVPLLFWMFSNIIPELNAFGIFGFFLLLVLFSFVILFCFVNYLDFYISKKQYQEYLENFKNNSRKE